MKQSQVKLGGTYTVKVSGVLVPVKLVRENSRGGWDGVNVTTGRAVRIRTAARLRKEHALSPQSIPGVCPSSELGTWDELLDAPQGVVVKTRERCSWGRAELRQIGDGRFASIAYDASGKEFIDREITVGSIHEAEADFDQLCINAEVTARGNPGLAFDRKTGKPTAAALRELIRSQLLAVLEDEDTRIGMYENVQDEVDEEDVEGDTPAMKEIDRALEIVIAFAKSYK
jgi:hypothetical protein